MINRFIFILSIVLFGCSEPNQSTESSVAENNSEEVIDANSVIQLKWEDLTDISFKDVYSEEAKDWIPYPTFGNSVKKLDQQYVSITGYMVPLGTEKYALSANPFASCFFCGNAGPESVMDLELKDYDQTYFTDDYVTFRGKLILNDSDLKKMCYVLVEATDISL